MKFCQPCKRRDSWWVWERILEDPDHPPHYRPHPTTTTEAPAAQMFPCVDAEPQSPRDWVAVKEPRKSYRSPCHGNLIQVP